MSAPSPVALLDFLTSAIERTPARFAAPSSRPLV